MRLEFDILLLYIGISLAQECGHPVVPPKPNKDRIINGEEAIPHSFPWMVSIQGQIDPHYCGASFLSPNWVLTAGHCGKIIFTGEYFSDQVVLGEHNRDLMQEEGESFVLF